MKSLYESILSSAGAGRKLFEVDLGLSVNWCSCDVGATKPEEAGLYFAWGDTRGYKESEIKKGVFTETWYKTLHASKIQSDLELNEDAAHKYLKGDWRMPNDEEVEELICGTNQTLETVNGVKGIRFSSVSNNNSIFIPFGGFVDNDEIMGSKREFDLWSASEDRSNYFGRGSKYDKNLAIFLFGDLNKRPLNSSMSKWFGYNIRGVHKK